MRRATAPFRAFTRALAVTLPLAAPVLVGGVLAIPVLTSPVLTGPAMAQPRSPTPAPAAPGGATRPTGQTNRIVAVVNGDIVTASEINNRTRLFALNAGMGPGQQVIERLTPQVTRLLIDERLRFQEVQRRRIPVTDEDVADAVRDIESRNGLPGGALAEQLRSAGVQPRALYDQIRNQIGWSRLVRQQLGNQREIDNGQVTEFIAGHKARTGEPEYLVSEIFVPVDDPAAEPEVKRFVDDVVTQLRAGIAFPAAATQFSQSQTALQGGDMGWVRPEEFDPAVARVVTQMPAGAIANPVRVPGGFQIVALRQKRETGRELATLVRLRQAFLPFSSALDPQNPTQQQRDAVEKARTLQGKDCTAVEAAGRGQTSAQQADPGELRMETMQPPALRNLVAGLALNRASQPIVTPEGVLVIAVCSRETRNLAELTPDQARNQILRDRAELTSRQLQRDLRRRAAIEMRS